LRRRHFLKSALLAPAAMLAGCRLSLEQGLMSECRVSAGYSPATAASIAQAWNGLRADQVWDCHAHLFGNGRGGSGIWIEPEFDQPATIAGRVRKAFFMNGGCVGDDEARIDAAMVERLTLLADELPPGAKVMLLAFDFTYDEAGARREDLTTFAVPDRYASAVARRRPDRFEWIASIHPYRRDAVAALETAKAAGARAVKWLPSAMGIDLAHSRSRTLYEALRKLEMPLLTHVGEEQAVHGAGRGELGNPLHLRQPLDAGVRVIAAHCASLGASPDLDVSRDPAKAPEVPNFELFARLMRDPGYDGRLFGDISAVTQANRAGAVAAVLAHPEWEGRLLNGSDYPLPGIMPLFSLNRMVKDGVLDGRAVPVLRELRPANALLFDFVLKRNLRHQGRALPASAFETRGFFERSPQGVT
jgi:hypothetical protein